jgi:hypothetical protein
VIPESDSSGNLPPGIHPAIWSEFEAKYGTNSHRKRLLAGLQEALVSLKAAGCTTVYVDGSFITSATVPGDFDACWEMTGVDLPVLYLAEPVLFDFRNRRAAQKVRFGGELFPARQSADSSGTIFLEFFQRDKDSGDAKGIIAIDLGSL